MLFLTLFLMPLSAKAALRIGTRHTQHLVTGLVSSVPTNFTCWSYRKLRGNLTLDTSKFKWLQALNLSTNHLESEIPSHWGCSRSLKSLDLSNNQLQGAIPSSLNQLTQLLTLNLSMNHLQGLLPQGGVLSSLSIASYQLNNLCGLPITLACDTRRSIAENTDTTINAASPVVFAVSKSSGVQFVKNKKLSIVVIVIVCVATLAISKLFLGGLWYWRRTRQRNVCEIKLSGGKVVLFQMAGKPNLSTTVLMEKIEKLTAEDIIGTGGFGTVYRLVLDDQTALAVKKLIRGIDRDRGFERELEALADLKHKNLVTLRGHYSAPNINILLYDLVGNGSLDTWLYGAYFHVSRIRSSRTTASGLGYASEDRDWSCSRPGVLTP